MRGTKNPYLHLIFAGLISKGIMEFTGSSEKGLIFFTLYPFVLLLILNFYNGGDKHESSNVRK